MLVELTKVNAPSLLLSEFNYFFNKAINNYINSRYNIYDTVQLTTDDIRVLKATTILTPKKAYTNNEEAYPATSRLSSSRSIIANLQGATYEVTLPSDYLHLLNCVCVYKVNKNWKCYDGGSYVQFPATRLTADSWSLIMNNFYNRPTPERPYFYIHNVNLSYLTDPEYSEVDTAHVPTNPLEMGSDGETTRVGTDVTGTYSVLPNGDSGVGPDGEQTYSLTDNAGSNFPRVMLVGENSNIMVSTVERATGYRYGNASQVRMEIRYGKDNSVFELVEVQVDYIKAPLHIRLTQELMDLTEDTSQIMEFPDYVCQEIINELTKLVMVRTADPVLNNFIPVNLTIPSAAQALLAQAAQA